MRKLARVILPLLASLGVAGCPPLFTSPVCSEFHQVRSSGDIGVPGSPRLGRLEFNLVEPSDSTAQSEIDITGFGPDSTAGPLRGHIAKLRVTSAAGVDLFTPIYRPVAVSEGGNMLFLSATGVDHAAMTDIRGRTLAGDIRVEVTTDATPAQVFVVALRVTTSGEVQVCPK